MHLGQPTTSSSALATLATSVMAGLIAISGCEAESDPTFGTLQWQGEYIEVWASEGLTNCESSFAHLDGYLEAFRAEVLRDPSDEVHRYYWVHESEIAGIGCGEVAGCTTARNNIYATGVPTLHELVHAERPSGRHPALAEGLAEVFGDEDEHQKPGVDPAVLRDSLNDSDAKLPGEAYDQVGQFVRFLIDRHGLERVLAFERESEDGMNYEELDEVFRRVADGSLDEELDAFQDLPSDCSEAGYRMPLMECKAPPLLNLDEGSWRETFSLDCASHGMLGPRSDRIWTNRTFTIEEPSTVRVVVDRPEGVSATVRISACEQDCSTQLVHQFAGAGERTFDLRPGAYWIRISAPADAAFDLEFEMRRE